MLRLKDKRIVALTLDMDGKPVSVPKAAYIDLQDPLLHTLELRTESRRGNAPRLYVYFELAYKTSDGHLRPKRVHITYHEGRIESRSIDVPITDDESVWKEEKL